MSLLKKVIRLAYENPSLRRDLLPVIIQERIKVKVATQRKQEKVRGLWEQFFGDNRVAKRFKTYLTDDPEGLVRKVNSQGAVFEDPDTGLKNTFSTVLRKAELRNEWALSEVEGLFKKFEKWDEENRSEGDSEQDELEMFRLSVKEFLAQSEESYQEVRSFIEKMDWGMRDEDTVWKTMKSQAVEQAIRTRGLMSYKSLIKRDGKYMVGFGNRLVDGLAFGFGSRYERFAIIGAAGVQQLGKLAGVDFLGDALLMAKRGRFVEELQEQGVLEDELEEKVAEFEREERKKVEKYVGADALKTALAEELAYQAQRYLFKEIFEVTGAADIAREQIGGVLSTAQHLPKGEILQQIGDLASKYMGADKLTQIMAVSGMKQVYFRAIEGGLKKLEAAGGHQDTIDVFRKFFRDSVDSSKAKAQTSADVNSKYQAKATALIKRIDAAEDPTDLLGVMEELSSLCRDYMTEGVAEIDEASERYVLTNKLHKLREVGDLFSKSKGGESESMSLLDSLVTKAYEKSASAKKRRKTEGDIIPIPQRAFLLYQSGRMQILKAMAHMEVSRHKDKMIKLIKKDLEKAGSFSGEDMKKSVLTAMDDIREGKYEKA